MLSTAGYSVAQISDSVTRARKKMEEKIAEGRASAAHLLNVVNTQVPKDVLARGHAFDFGNDPNSGDLIVGLRTVNEDPYTIHRHARGQFAQRAGVPTAFINDLLASPETWKKEMAAHILNEHFNKKYNDRKEDVSSARHLVRSVNGNVRGVLSDRYRRLDSRPLLEAFAEECQTLGAVPVEGSALDTRVALKAFLPMVFEPVPNEVMCLGVEWSNSDYGAGKHALRAFIFRLACFNGATMEDALSQVHLGGRLADDIEFSDKTFQLDTRAQVSALRDVVRGTLGPKSVNSLLETIKQADEKKIEWRQVSTLLSKRLLKEELKAVKDAFEGEDVINLPEAKSIWRASNAVSWIAGHTDDEERKLELQKLAGEVIHGKREDKAA